MLPEFWLPGTQIMGARDKAGTTDGFYFSALGGHNGESHNHNDVGSCILFYNGEPFLIDIGSEVYTRQTFGPERYSIWTMQSCLPQPSAHKWCTTKEGEKYKARNPQFKTSAAAVDFSLDIAAAYPDAANVKEWVRSYRLTRGKSFTISDKYTLNENNGKTELHFMAAVKPEKLKEGVLRLTNKTAVLELKFNAAELTPVIETIEVKDKRLQQSWGANVYRVIFTMKAGKNNGQNTLLFTPAGK